MWATLTLLSALSLPAADAGDLQLNNARVTYGRFGPTRKDTKFLPGDVYFVTFDIEGLQFNKEGQAKYSTKMELFDPKGASKFKSLDVPFELYTIQGGGKVSSDAFAEIQKDDAPGKYKMVVTVTDTNTKKTAKLTREYEVADKAFGIVRLSCAFDDRDILPAPAMGTIGQTLFLHYALTGFDRDPKTKQPKFKLETRMLDESGKPTLEQPVTRITAEGDPVPEKDVLVPFLFPLALTKAGKYTVELTATDVLSKKTATVTWPLIVQEPPK
jgi:hypothetical protein